MNGEIDGAGGLRNREVEIFADIMVRGDGNASVGGGFNDGLAHAAGFSSDEEIWHVSGT